MSVSLFARLTVWFLAITQCAYAIEVIPPTGVNIPSYKSNIQYEGIPFEKRAKNDSVHLSLRYSVNGLSEDNADLTWEYNGNTLVVGVPADKSKCFAEREFSKSVLTVTLHLKDDVANAGLYNLTVTSNGALASGVTIVKSAPILPIYSKPKRVLQGDPLRISCRVSGYPTPSTIEWSFAPIPVELSDDKAAISDAANALAKIDFESADWTDSKLSMEDGTPNDTLRFGSLAIAHNGLFVCNTSNELGGDMTFLLVGVKNRWAALWPFIGIVVEVTVLVAAILLYERHQIRSKPAAAASDNNANVDANTPANGQAGADKNLKPDEVRLRGTRA